MTRGRGLALVACLLVVAGALGAGVIGLGDRTDADPRRGAGPGTAAAADPPRAAPPPRPAVTLLVKGDWGYGGPAQAALTRRMCDVARRDGIRTVLTTGDNFYRPDGRATAANWTRPEACLRGLGVRWRPVWGNHDLGGDATARVLGESRRRYTFRQGPMRVIVLDANDPADPDQTAFLRDTLAARDTPVTVVAFHQPAQTSGLHAPGAEQRRRWVPLFRRYGVTLVLQGHNHAYERLVVDGVTYVTTGGGGAPLTPCVRPARGLETCRLAHHFLRLAVDEGGVEVRAIDTGGRIMERVRVPARRSGEAVG